MSALEAAVEHLKALPPDKLAEVVVYLRRLSEENQVDRAAALERSGGSLSAEAANALESALADCRKIDRDEW